MYLKYIQEHILHKYILFQKYSLQVFNIFNELSNDCIFLLHIVLLFVTQHVQK